MPNERYQRQRERQLAYKKEKRLEDPIGFRISHNKYCIISRRRKGAKIRTKPSPKIGRIDRLDLIALQDPTIAKGRPPL